jgi:16S rRNA (cytosine967-C5)-methyltransferase
MTRLSGVPGGLLLRNPRKIAWETVRMFDKTHSDPDEILDSLIDPLIDTRDRALAWEIAKGTIRYLKKLDYIAQFYIKAPLKSQKPKVLAALRIGLYQLLELDSIPQFAAVDQTVKLIADEGMKRDAGFVNAILRSYLREPAKVKYPNPEDDPISYLSVFYSYPEWLVKRWHSRYGYIETVNMLITNNLRPKTFFRVINRKVNKEIVLEHLVKEGIDVEAGGYFPDFISTDDGQAVIKSQLFKGGSLLVQDESQGLPIYLLDPGPGDEVLDLCSAPGGKTIVLADTVGPAGKVISLDKDPKRLKLVVENAQRIGFENIEYITSDLFDFAPNRHFKYILLDVPCSGLGTLSHNVDLRWTKTEKDIKDLAKLQSRMLKKAANLLAVGGSLVYSTCTTEPEEIEDVLDRFLKSERGFRLVDGESETIREFRTRTGIYRTWPHKNGMGGGGFALLRKKNGA